MSVFEYKAKFMELSRYAPQIVVQGRRRPGSSKRASCLLYYIKGRIAPIDGHKLCGSTRSAPPKPTHLLGPPTAFVIQALSNADICYYFIFIESINEIRPIKLSSIPTHQNCLFFFFFSM